MIRLHCLRHSCRQTAAGLALAASLLVLHVPGLAFDAQARPIPAQGTLQAAFAPWEDVEALLIQTLEGARRQILMQAYLLTSKKIAAALIAAHQRGIDVRVLADEAQSHMDSAKISAVAAAGIPVWLETKYQNAHNKVIVLDAGTPSATVVTGSFNFTWTAQHKNAENILIARDAPALASRYALNWERHRADAMAYPTAGVAQGRTR